MSQIESYQLYHRFSEAVIGLPAASAEMMEALPSLPYSGFAVCTPCDGESETPHVPAFLPRPLPLGQYTWGLYATKSDLFVLLDTQEGPEIEALKEREDALEQLTLFQPDGLWYRTLRIPLEGKATLSTHVASHGPRKGECTEPEWDWEARRIATGPRRWRTLWRVALRDLKPLLRNGALRASLSRTSIRFHEGVAWGAYPLWGPRFDECGEFRFEEDPAARLTPQLLNLRLDYDHAQSKGRLRFQWSGGYGPEETRPNHPNELSRNADWGRFTARVNHQLQQFTFADTGASAPFSFRDGLNEIHVATRGGTALRLTFEAWPDTRLVFPPWLNLPAASSRATATPWTKEQLEHYIAQAPAPFSLYGSWMGKIGSAVALWSSEANANPCWKEWLRELGEFTLGLQREDGTFAGFHLNAEKLSKIPWQGGAYDSGPIGEFWVCYYQLTGDERFLEASRRLVHAYSQYRIEFNPNYAAFGVYHLAAHYKATGEAEALDHLVYYLTYCVTPGFLPLGFHGGHNYYTVYASIILRALGAGAEVLPESHALRPRLIALARRMGNQVLARLQEDGSIDSRDRHFIGETLWSDGLFAIAPLLEGAEQKQLLGLLDFTLAQAIEATHSAHAPLSNTLSSYSNPSSLATSPSVARFLRESWAVSIQPSNS